LESKTNVFLSSYRKHTTNRSQILIHLKLGDMLNHTFLGFLQKSFVLCIMRVRKKSCHLRYNYFKSAISLTILWSAFLVLIYSIPHSTYCSLHARRGDTVISKAGTSASEKMANRGIDNYWTNWRLNWRRFSITQVQGLLPQSLFSLLKLNSIHD
jgi:hypothetical protein